jgi:methylthioxylose transferase
VATAAGAGALVAAAAVIGAVLRDQAVPLHALTAPLVGIWQPRLAEATVPAAALAVLLVVAGPPVATRLRWSVLLPVAWATSLTWIVALGLVDGWGRLAARLARPGEYLAEVAAVPTMHELLVTFADRIAVRPTASGGPDAWATHVAGHPPGALVFFVLLDRVGLGGGGWAAAVCMVLGASACVAVALTVRALAGDQAARSALPFLVLAPAALWIGVSGDAVFLAVSAWGVCLLALATKADGWRRLITGGTAGLLLGLSLYLSYGLALLGLVAAAVLVVGRSLATLVVGGVGVVTVVVAFTASGFWWWDGYEQIVVRYYQGWGAERPYSYWVWANLAALAICVGPATAAGLRRALPAVRVSPVAAVAVSALVAVVVGTLSGLSKAEVERIWLPFAVWLVAACALLPARSHRWWLGAQALTTLVVQHLILTSW